MKPTNYISIHEVLSRLTRHPLLQDVTKERVVSHLVDFINILGYYPLYEHREDIVDITNYRGVIPCDVVSIDYVKDPCSDVLLRAMTDVMPNQRYDKTSVEDTWKIQGNILFTSFREGKVQVAYTTIPADDEGFPLLVDNSNFLKAFELYVKKEVFTVLFDLSKINQNVLQHAEQEYAWAVGQLRSEMNIPDVSQMESLRRMWCTLIQTDTHFNTSFRDLGNQELIRNHR